jgi:hypothetical protein
MAMKVKDEVMKVIEALKASGFKPVDAMFEGAMGVNEDTTLEFVDRLNDNQSISGVIRVIYTSGDEQSPRFVEIPVGNPQDSGQAQEGK